MMKEFSGIGFTCDHLQFQKMLFSSSERYIMEDIPFHLNFIENRVLGVVIEKSLTTPDQMPLTLNSCVLGCNQSSNRDPVTQLSEQEVDEGLDALVTKHLLVRVHGAGSRAPKFDTIATDHWKLEREDVCVLSILMLRGEQTPGELSIRSKRACPDLKLEEVLRRLDELSRRDQPFVEKLERLPGQKEARWKSLIQANDNECEEMSEENSPPSSVEDLREEVSALKVDLLKVREELREIRESLGI